MPCQHFQGLFAAEMSHFVLQISRNVMRSLLHLSDALRNEFCSICGGKTDGRVILEAVSRLHFSRQYIQGDPSARRLHFVVFDLVVPLSALFCLGSCKSGRIGMPCRQHGGTLKSESTEYSH